MCVVVRPAKLYVYKLIHTKIICSSSKVLIYENLFEKWCVDGKIELRNMEIGKNLYFWGRNMNLINICELFLKTFSQLLSQTPRFLAVNVQ